MYYLFETGFCTGFALPNCLSGWSKKHQLSKYLPVSTFPTVEHIIPVHLLAELWSEICRASILVARISPKL